MVHIYGIFGREITVYTVIYGAYIRYFWQGNHQIYGHIWYIYTVLANRTYLPLGRIGVSFNLAICYAQNRKLREITVMARPAHALVFLFCSSIRKTSSAASTKAALLLPRQHYYYQDSTATTKTALLPRQHTLVYVYQ